jgi:hypothetical protein
VSQASRGDCELLLLLLLLLLPLPPPLLLCTVRCLQKYMYTAC